MERAQKIPPQKESARIVDHAKSLDQFAIEVANRHIRSEDVKNSVSLPIPSENLEALTAAGSQLTERIISGLRPDTIVVFNNDQDKLISGVEMTDTGFRGVTVARYKHGDEKMRKFDLSDVQLHGEFGENGNYTVSFCNPDETEPKMQIVIPGHMKPGEQSSIVIADLVTNAQSFGPIHRDIVDTHSYYRLEKEERETHGNSMKATSHYRKMTATTHIKLHDEGLLLRTRSVNQREVLAVNGLQDGVYTYLEPSGWFLATEE